jgi:hypothetical protein
MRVGRMTSAVAVLLLTVAGCGGGDDASSDTTVEDEQSTPSMERSTTSTTERPTTTTVPEVAVDFTSAAGFKYRLVLEDVGTSPDASEGECVAIAPPGKTNLVVSLTLGETNGELQPSNPGLPCDSGTPDPSVLDLTPGGSVDLELVFGPVADPPPTGLILFFRLFDGFDNRQDLSLPLEG